MCGLLKRMERRFLHRGSGPHPKRSVPHNNMTPFAARSDKVTPPYDREELVHPPKGE
jgi:hypothetical protein